MFFSYCMGQGFVIPQLFQFLPQTQNHGSQPSNSNLSKNGVDDIELTKQDHLKAGYDKIKKPWTEEQDKKLKHLRDYNNFQWEQIAQELPGRNAKMCYSRHKRLEYKPREHWKPQEDLLLRKLVEEHGEDWPLIVGHFENRTPKQVKDHYNNYLKCYVTRDHWTLEEDMLLVELLNRHGRNWKNIEDALPGRTQNQIKNRYFGRIKKLQEKKARNPAREEEVS